MTTIQHEPDMNVFEKQAEQFSLIPLIGKAPFEKEWLRWCEIKRDFNPEDFVGHNAGVCCGPASGVLVLDVDDPVAFRALVEANGLSIPDTYTVMTGTDKPHYYFHYPIDEERVGNKSLKHPVFSKYTIFDLRGQGGQVVAAGSIHPDTKKPYRIEKDIPVASLPGWLSRFLRGESINTDILWEIPLPEPRNREFIESLSVPSETRRLILEGKPVGERSEAVMTVINALLRTGYEERIIFYVFDHYAIGEKYREKGLSKARWLNEEIRRARQYLNLGINQQQEGCRHEREIEQLNEKHAVVMLGGKCLVMNEVVDPVFGRPDVTFSTYWDFKNYYSNWKVPNPNGGYPREVSIAKVWFESPNRRQYEGIVFDPEEKDIDGYYNLFRGFAFEPRKGNWSLFRKHILEVIASQNEEAYRYLLAWMAHLVQKPGGIRPGTAIVLRGKQGTGKGCFATQFGLIFGNHFLHITNQHQITGRFNNHLKDALLVFCDEGIWAGDKAAEGTLKGLITEEHLMVEPKGKDAFPIKNHLRLIVASNNDWVVPAGLEERRFFVLDVSDKYMQNREYFKAVFEQMDHGGREAMLYDLLEYDISGVDLRAFPRTEALMDQIVSSMSPVEKFWYERLMDGKLSEYDEDWKGTIQTDTMYKGYLDFAKGIGGRYQLSKSQFGKEIKKLCPKVERKRFKLDHPFNDERRWHHCFPSLEECREAFESAVNFPVNWEEESNAGQSKMEFPVSEGNYLDDSVLGVPAES